MDFVIQGAGPVGLACAISLLKNNPELKLTLLDKNSESDPSPPEVMASMVAFSNFARVSSSTLIMRNPSRRALKMFQHDVTVSLRLHHNPAPAL